ncbi:cell wall-binding repeat-containing protein [Bacillus sp. JJ1521]|uniref:cell wall-binding repeat-containing protein n=1 Tax=Bacillus sp. JJ1521 TaxID=3122957 RepID=UPI002FFE5E17
MVKIKKRLTIATLFFLLILSIHTYAFAAEKSYERIDGLDRFEVAVNASKKGWPQGSDTVILSFYNAFADALASTPLAYQNDAPILLTHQDKLTPTTRNEILRLSPSNVIIVGGPGSVSDRINSELAGLGIPNVRRIGGIDRYEVAYNISKELPSNQNAVVAYGLTFADALTIGPYAAKNGIPILLTKTSDLPSKTKQALVERNVTKTTVVGGEGSVSRQVFDQLPGATRIGGKDRYEVAANIVKQFRLPTNKVYVATGLTFADALTGSILAAKENAPILLTKSNHAPDQTKAIANRPESSSFVILGGRGSVEEPAVYDIVNPYRNSPIVYFVPHADDEVLTYSVDIRNEIQKGREVFLVLLSKGEDSFAREIANGAYDSESYRSDLAGQKVWCSWHKTYHNPTQEGFLHGHLSEAEFGEVRMEDFKRAGQALGVPTDHIITADAISLGNYYSSVVRGVVQKYVNLYPNGEFRTMSKHDLHIAHAMIGSVLEDLEREGILDELQTRYFVSIYTDRFAYKKLKEKVYVQKLQVPNDSTFVQSSIQIYLNYNPKQGIYATGYHSVQSQFDSMKNSTYTLFYY